MEEDGSSDEQRSSSFSWPLDDNDRPHQSQWLQTTLAELDWKIKKIFEVVEDNGDTFVQRAEMYYQKRPELIKMVGDLHKSYRTLAAKYDQMLRSDSLRASIGGCSTSNSFRQVQHNYNNSGLIMEPPDSASEHDLQSCGSDELTKQQQQEEGDDEDATSICCKHANTKKKKVVKDENQSDVAGTAVLEKQGWDELPVGVSKLIEENTSKQAELIKRYNKKRDDVKRLVNENKHLKDLLAQRKICALKQTQTPRNSNSKWKGSLFGKLLL